MSNAASTRQSSSDTATLLRTPASSRAPKRWLVRTANPAVRPEANPSTRKVTEPVLPTPAIASEETVCPTINVSAILYSC